jgi:hypothetical protein
LDASSTFVVDSTVFVGVCQIDEFSELHFRDGFADFFHGGPQLVPRDVPVIVEVEDSERLHQLLGAVVFALRFRPQLLYLFDPSEKFVFVYDFDPCRIKF